LKITPEVLLRAYMCGVFPMAETRDAEALFWIDPKRRGVIPLDRFHAPKSLVKAVRQEHFHVTRDADFPGVIRACAEPRPGHEETWINDEIIGLYEELFSRGNAHSVECWQDEKLVGGLYGVSIGGAFFGESMFHKKSDASKIALCHLVAHLKHGNFKLLDTQFVTEHLQQFGTVEITRDDYQKWLEVAINATADFHSLPADAPASTIVQLITQTS
jgi:leucyl/phenylalanyl-tRNA---protein transferase